MALANFKYQAPLITQIGIIGTNLLECIMASMLLKSSNNGKFKFRSPRDVFIFVSIAAFLAPFVSSTISITFLFIGQMIKVNQIHKVWTTYFIGNSLGILLITPLVLSYFSKNRKKIKITEFILLNVTLALVSYWAFEGEGIRKFLLLPLLTWGAFRFSFRGVSVATMIVGLMAIWRSTFLWGIFDSNSETDLLWIQCLTAASAIVGYFMATVGEVQEEAISRELEHNYNLQHKRILEESLAILDQSLNKSPIGFALVDKELRYLRINESLARYNKLDSAQHLGRKVTEIIADGDQQIIPFIEQVFATGDAFMNIAYRSTKDIGPCPVSGIISFYPVRHPITNEIFACGVTFQDMSEELHTQNLLREHQDFLTFAQEAGKIGSFEWDMYTNRILWTSELETIYGLGPGEFGGFYESWMKWIHPEDRDRTIEEVKKILRGEGELNLELRIITKSHDVKWILARGKMVRDINGKNIKFIGINIDLTEQKTIEQKLRVTEANLLHALSVRDEFMAIASHELKTPLTSLKLQLQLHQRAILRNDPLAYAPEKIHNLLEKNGKQIDRLTRLVDDMLDISRIRTGKLSIKKEPCELSSMLKDILGRIHEQFEASGSGEPIIDHIETASGEWDPLRIEQVMTNIITNAIRYGRGKPVHIAIKNYQESVRITVKDQGLGIPKSDQEKIFQRYERGLLAREISGLGIGLFITHQIIEAHGGKIWVESEIGQGSTFYVDLPRTSLPILLKPNDATLIPIESWSVV